MKFKIELDFDDLYIEEGSISQELERSITQKIVGELQKQISEKTMTAISSAVKTTIETTIDGTIAAKIKEVIDTKKIKQQYGSDLMTIDEFIENTFGKTDLNKRTQDFIEKCCKSFIEEIKKNYDMAFAAHVVKNMQANNLLKDNVAELLLKS